MGYMIGLNINHVATADSLSVEMVETMAQLEDGEERSDSDDALDFVKFKVDGGDDDGSGGFVWLPELPNQILFWGWPSLTEAPSVSIPPGTYPASFTRPPMFILHRNFKVFPA